MENLKGCDAAYQRLLGATYDGGAKEVKRIAQDLIPECWEICAGMALADIDTAHLEDKMLWPYQTVVNVLDELIEKRKENQ